MQKFLNTELGRSLVEMLGVLAIIGVLSIGAIAGYSYAVTKWKAGEILSDLHTRAIEYTRQMAQVKKIAPDFQFKNFELGDENSLGNPVAGFPVSGDPNFFEIDVRGISAEVCEQIIRDFAMPIIDVALNDGAYGALEEDCRVETPNDLVTMTFLFSKYLDEDSIYMRGKMTTFSNANANTTSGKTTSTAPSCPEGEEVVWYSDENGNSQGACCPSDAGGYAWADGKCCASGERASNGHCCPHNNYKGGWGLNVDRCCTTEEKLSWAYDAERKTQYYCCPSASDGWGVNVNRCCDADQGEKRYYNYGSSINGWNYFCCPSNGGTGGWGENVNRCCDADQGEKRYENYDRSNQRQNSFCCPENGGTGGWGVNVQRCCTAEETRVYDNQYGYYHCCPTGQTWDSITWRCVGGDTTQCATNDDCLANEFCAYPNATSCTVKPTTGICQPATVSHTKTIKGVTYKRSSARMYWWSAENFCARIGGSMVSVSDFECEYDFVGKKDGYGYCNADDTDSWKGVDSLSDTMKEFLSGLGSSYVWTDDDYSACGAYGVDLNDGYVGSNDRDTNYYNALCRVGG